MTEIAGRLPATNQGYDFYLITILQTTVSVLFAWNQLHVAFNGAIAIVDVQFQQQVSDGPVTVYCALLAVESDRDHDP